MELIYISSGILLCFFTLFISLSNFFSRMKGKRKNSSPEKKKRKEMRRKEKNKKEERKEKRWKRRRMNFSSED